MTLAYVPAPAAPAVQCPSKGSRDCFPRDLAEPHFAPADFDDAVTFVPPGASLTADTFFGDSPQERGSGRVYHVTIGRHQSFCDPETGRERYISFAAVHIKVPVEPTFMGFGEQDQVVAYVAEHYPSWEVVESHVIGTGY